MPETNALEVLLKKAAQGDVSAFEEIISQYEKLIYNIAYRILGNREDALDAAQESLIKIYKNIHKCGDIKAFRAWVCKITGNTCIDELRRRKNKREESLNRLADNTGGQSVPIQLESGDTSPEDVLLNREKSAKLQQAVDMLPAKYKVLIVLRDINGLSYEELAAATGLSMGTVKSRLSRSRDRLRKIIDEIKY